MTRVSGRPDSVNSRSHGKKWAEGIQNSQKQIEI